MRYPITVSAVAAVLCLSFAGAVCANDAPYITVTVADETGSQSFFVPTVAYLQSTCTDIEGQGTRDQRRRQVQCKIARSRLTKPCAKLDKILDQCRWMPRPAAAVTTAQCTSCVLPQATRAGMP